MRTTVELPANLRQKLVNEAARRNEKGYSRIIVEALELYFHEHSYGRNNPLISALRGAMTDDEYADAVATLNQGRGNWRM